jgi:hypothetical protein
MKVYVPTVATTQDLVRYVREMGVTAEFNPIWYDRSKKAWLVELTPM